MQSTIDKFFKKKIVRDFGPNRPLPIVMVDDMVYMVRLTPEGHYTRDALIRWLDEEFFEWIIGEEVAKKLHYHIVIITSDDIYEMRTKVQSFLHTWYPFDERGRGWGNRQYNLQQVESVDKAILYTVKDGNVAWSDGICSDMIEDYRKISYAKYDKVTFAKELQAIQDKFKSYPDMTVKEFMIEVVLLKSKYRQTINLRYIHQMANGARVHREPEWAEWLVDQYFEKNL